MRLEIIFSFLLFSLTVSGLRAQIQTGVFRNTPENLEYNQFIRNGIGAAVYINQQSTEPDKSILRLSSGTVNPNENVKFTVENNGNVGINTTVPKSKLQVSSTESDALRIYRTGIADKYLDIWHGTGGAVIDPIRTDNSIGVLYLGYRNPSNIILNLKGGRVGIGTDSPDAKLTVKGNIHAQEVKVDLAGAVAPDYVFLKDYQLKTLDEVDSYIQVNGHLPNIPSAAIMEKEGVKLKEMNLKLLEKIEELTLYMIAQEKEIQELKKDRELNSLQNNRILKLEKQLESLIFILKNK
ncbi:hypothetical protein ACE939_10980 [Aquimarina sp. W85]|uniref:hypothetical protein n=1 Tax=Aquimarina rhodophyticola TaxID=3342246 RepID=UPI0036724E1A